MERSKRIHNFDFLRGFFVFLALYQHFTYYLNKWYFWLITKNNVAEGIFFRSQYKLIDTPVSTDPLGEKIFWFFTPWVSQVYLCLAAFNLATRNREDFSTIYKGKLWVFFWLFIMFFCENAVAALDAGELLSFYPLMAWMVILGILTLMYRYLGVKWIIGIWAISIFHPLTPIDSVFNSFVSFMKLYFHTDYEYDARIHYFFSSGALGFILGWLHFQKDWFSKNKNLILSLSLALVMYLIWFFAGESFPVNPLDVLETEHHFNKIFTGVLFNQAVQIFVLVVFLWMHLKNIQVFKNVFHWVGVNSLLVFVFHRIFFVYLIAPLRQLIGAAFDIPMTAYTLEVFGYAFVSILMSYLLYKSPIPKLIFNQGK